MYKIETANKEIDIAPIEDILDKSPYVSFNDHVIEITDVIAFFKEESSSGLVHKIAEMSDWITYRMINMFTAVKIDEESFNDMLSVIKETMKIEDRLVFKEPLIWEKTIVLNISNICKDMIYREVGKDYIVINNMIFSTNKAEYHGSAMFSNRKSFFVPNDIFEKIVSITSKHI